MDQISDDVRQDMAEQTWRHESHESHSPTFLPTFLISVKMERLELLEKLKTQNIPIIMRLLRLE